MQSSATNCLKARLKTTIQSPRLRRAGDSGAVPELTAVDKSEAAGLGLGLAFSTLPEDQSHHRTDPARDDEARRESAAGSFARSLAEMLVASLISLRRESTELASALRSLSMRRRSSVVAPSSVAIRLQCGCRQLGLLDRLPRDGRSAAFQRPHGEQAEQPCSDEQKDGDQEQREPGGHELRQPSRDRREREADGVEDEEERTGSEDGSQAERSHLRLELHRRELELQAGERARVLRDLLGGLT